MKISWWSFKMITDKHIARTYSHNGWKFVYFTENHERLAFQNYTWLDSYPEYPEKTRCVSFSQEDVLSGYYKYELDRIK